MVAKNKLPHCVQEVVSQSAHPCRRVMKLPWKFSSLYQVAVSCQARCKLKAKEKGMVWTIRTKEVLTLSALRPALSVAVFSNGSLLRALAGHIHCGAMSVPAMLP